jgi:hypothetical protein
MLFLRLLRMLRTVSVRSTGFILIGGMLLFSPVVPSQAQSSCSTLSECLKDLKSDDAPAKSSAIFRLGRLRDKRAVPPLVEVLKKDSRLEIQISTIRALGLIGDPSAVTVLSGSLKNRELQDETVKALIRIGGKPAVNVFVKALKSKKTQLAGLQGLAEAGDQDTKQHILSVYRNATDERIRGIASIAIHRIRSRWGPTEEEMGLPIYPVAKYSPNARAEWIFTTGDSVNKVVGFYQDRLEKKPMKFKTFKQKHESGFVESKEGLPSDRPDMIFVVEEQKFKGKNYPSKLIFLRSKIKETEIHVFHAVGAED